MSVNNKPLLLTAIADSLDGLRDQPPGKLERSSLEINERDSQREIVVEYESVSLVRKRSRTRSLFCKSCERDSEFVSLIDASKLFEVEIEKLAEFIEVHDCHFQCSRAGAIYICLLSFLSVMKAKAPAD
jgi:hypothetical protein